MIFSKKNRLNKIKKLFICIIYSSLAIMMIACLCLCEKEGQESIKNPETSESGEKTTEVQAVETQNTEEENKLEEVTTAESAEQHETGTEEPGSLTLRPVNTDGFGTQGNNGIDRIIDAGQYMYLGVDNRQGTIVYRSADKGETWEAISKHGINGDKNNIFTTTLVWFNGCLYVGTWQLKSGAQLFRANADAENVPDIAWQAITLDGFSNPNNNGFTNGIVFDGYIYVGCFNLTEGSEMYRSSSGDPGTWQMCIPKGYGREDNSDSTCLYAYDGYLYVGTESVRGDMSGWAGTAIYRTDGKGSPLSWQKVCPDGYGDKYNNNTGAITVFKDHMYAGTWNYSGLQVWRTDMTGELPWEWERVVNGGFGSSRNDAVQGLAAAGDDLFCASCGELSLNPGAGTGKLLKSSDGTNWAEITQEGFIEGKMIGILWMISANEKLYIGLLGANLLTGGDGLSQLWIYE